MPYVRFLINFVLIFFLAGCFHAPSVVVFGAAFPDWLLCILLGVSGTAIVHVTLGYFNKRIWLLPHMISYPALVALIATFVWILAFPH